MSRPGEELLIVDEVDRDRDGLKKLFEAEGYLCTAVKEDSVARSMLRKKFFPVALIDMDFGGKKAGLELVEFIREHSAPTRVVMLAGRPSFDGAVSGLRAGVVDVVVKQRDQVEHLQQAVRHAVDRYRAGDKDGVLLHDVRNVLDEALRIMLSMTSKAYVESSGDGLQIEPTILIVDQDQEFLTEVAKLLKERPWDVSVELSGGSGLDRASTFSFQIIAARQQLPDLPGHMLIKSVQAQSGDSLGLLYDAEQGHVQRYEDGQVNHTEPRFGGPEHLVQRLSATVSDAAVRRQERRQLRAFRAEHGTFLKRYAELKSRLDAVSD